MAQSGQLQFNAQPKQRRTKPLLVTQPKHELGLLLFGTAEDNSRCVLGEEGGQLCQALVDRDGLIDAPDVEMLSRVEALGGTKASEEPADAVGALALALTMLERRCEKRKHEKTIYLYTDSGTPFNEADLEDTGSEADLNLSSVVRKLAADRACLKVVGLGFAGSAAAGPDPAAPAGPAGPAGPEAEWRRLAAAYPEQIALVPAEVARSHHPEDERGEDQPHVPARGRPGRGGGAAGGPRPGLPLRRGTRPVGRVR